MISVGEAGFMPFCVLDVASRNGCPLSFIAVDGCNSVGGVGYALNCVVDTL
jgi:hypothetical protein